MNVDRRWLGTSVVRVRGLAAGLVLLAAGCMVLGWGSRSRQNAANTAVGPSLVETVATLGPEPQAQAASFLAPLTPAEAASLPQTQARSLFAGLPLMFEPNQGQANLDPADARARFVARGSGYSLFLGSQGATVSLLSQGAASQGAPKLGASKQARVESLQMRLAGANPNASLTAADPLPSKKNYLLGNDPAKWRRGVPQFARVRYENIYPGINLVFYGNQGRLEYDFQVAPGSDPTQAELEFDGAKGLELKDGALVIRGQGRDLKLEAPRVYQQIAGRQEPVEGSFVLRGANRAGFAIGAYDHSRELVIDPVLSFSTYFGGSGDEFATSVAVDGGGNIYLAGSTNSPNLPSAGTTLVGARNVYIAKITPPQGTTPAILQYVTYLGGSGTDTPAGIAVDVSGNASLAGTTSSPNFPTTLTAYQTAPDAGSPGPHVFVTALDATGATLDYSSYLSGNGTDIASGVAIDVHGYIYATGTTTSVETSTTDQFPASNLPEALPFQNFSRAPGLAQFFVTKVNTQNQRTGSIAYSTYFGGGNFVPLLPPPAPQTPTAVGGGIAVDTNGNIYFTGTTNFTYTGCAGCSTTDFPILNAYQPCLNQTPPTVVGTTPLCTNTSTTAANSDAFVAKLNPNASAGTAQLQWSTYLGGTQTDSGTGIAIDSGAANVYITGTTNSTDVTALTTFASFQPCLNNLYTLSGTLEACTTQTAAAPNDAFVARLTNPATSTTTTNVSLTYFSYLGGSNDEAGLAITVDTANGALVTGSTKSPFSATGTTVNPGSFPLFPEPTGAIQSQLTGGQDAFVARLNTAAVVGQTTNASWASYFGGGNTDPSSVLTEGTGIALDSNQVMYMAGDTNSNDLHLAKQLLANQGGGSNGQSNGGYDAFVTQLGTAATLSLTGQLTLGTDQVYISAGSQATFTYIVTNNGPDLAYLITVTDDIRQTTTGVPLTFVSASATAGTCSGGSTSSTISCTIQSLQANSTATITIVLTPTPSSNGGSAPFNGGAVIATAQNNITSPQVFVSAKMSDFALTASPSSVSVPKAGDTATYFLQLTPNPVYATNISLTCSGLPTGATCSFLPASVTLSSASPAAPTLSITTTARPITLPAASLFTRHFYALWLPIPGLALLGLGLGGDRRHRRIAGILLLCAVLMLLVLQPACSSKSTQPPVSGTPPGTWPITVTATSGSDTKNAPIFLDVP